MSAPDAQPVMEKDGRPSVSASAGDRSARDRSRRSRDRSRSRSRSHERRHRSSSRRHSRRSASRSPPPSRSRSRSRSPRRDVRRRRSRTRSRSASPRRRRSSRSRSRDRHRRRSRSCSNSRRRKSRSRERRERNEQINSASGASPAAAAAQTPSEPRRLQIVTREQRNQRDQRDQRRQNEQHNQRDHRTHRESHSAPSNSDPLARRPPPPPADRPDSLLSHVQPSSRGRYAYVFLVMKGAESRAKWMEKQKKKQAEMEERQKAGDSAAAAAAPSPPEEEEEEEAEEDVNTLGYACGAIIGAYSLRLSGTKHSLVCMVTPDVGESCRRRMRHIFTEVVEVPYLQYEVKPLRTQKQRNMYNSWVDAAFTKWNMLSLVQYEKTLFVDADKICIRNMDHLFEEMHTPAGTFSSPWSQPFVERKDQIAQRKGGAGQRSRYSGHRGMMNPYQQCGHNSRVTSSMIYSALTEQSFVVIGTVVLLSPSLEDYEQYKSMLTELVPFGFSDCHSMMDEQSLSYYFGIYKNQLIQRGVYGQLTARDSAAPAAPLPSSAVSEWSYIHHCYNYVPWHRYWLTTEEVPYTFHFFNTKPWVLDRTAWLDLEAWWELVLAMLQDSTLTSDARDDLRTLYPSAMLALPKNDGCCWCRLSEESFMALPTGAWKQHNVFDTQGRLQCPVMKAGFEREEKRRSEAANGRGIRAAGGEH